ncbi:mechanosensitive ion channel family protein [Stackebrandtia albiflava]|nr:mechanosensitive ion channel domain-containing protein [Stackebrandtia albiflava]
MVFGIGPVGVMVIAAVGGVVVVSLVRFALRPLARRVRWLDTVLGLVHRPAQLTAGLVAARISLQVTGPREWHDGVGHWLVLAILAASAWLVTRLLRVIRSDAEEGVAGVAAHDLDRRRRRTQAVIVYRVASAAIWVIAVGAGLLTFPAFRTFGAGVLASAGLAGVVAGLAAQSLLKDVFAGLQLAFGDSLRLGDIVVAEKEWGRVEELALTYVVVRIWDRRRLILPTSHFTTTPYANWTGRSQDLVSVVEFDVDWRLPVIEARRELTRIVAASPHWDGAEQGLVVTDATGPYLRIRATATAANADAWWELRCEIRERMVGWIAENHPDCVPRLRVEPGAAPEV